MFDTFSQLECTPRVSPVHIIGIGSPFGDDRIGWDAVAALDQSGVLEQFPSGSVRTFCCSHPALSLLSLMSGAKAAILIDAIRSGGKRGTVRQIDTIELKRQANAISSHGLSVTESLALGEALDLLPATLMIYGIEIGCIDASAAPAPETHAAILVLLHEIAIALQNLIGKRDCLP